MKSNIVFFVKIRKASSMAMAMAMSILKGRWKMEEGRRKKEDWRF
jgi:hypothetical protein